MRDQEERSRDQRADGRGDIARLIDCWQDEHDPAVLEALLVAVGRRVEHVVARTLRRHGIRDPAACDDATALVVDQIRRLGDSHDAAPVVRFEAGRTPAGGGADPGWAYLRCVAMSRARDVARDRRRWERRATSLATIAAAVSSPAADVEAAVAVADDLARERLHAAIAALDERSRTLVALLLDGKTQTVIAHVLGVCEGTVSRIRARAITRLRELLAE